MDSKFEETDSSLPDMQEGPGARVNSYGRLIAATPPTTRVPESHKGEISRPIPMLPNVAGYCDWCGKSFDQVALKTLGD